MEAVVEAADLLVQQEVLVELVEGGRHLTQEVLAAPVQLTLVVEVPGQQARTVATPLAAVPAARELLLLDT